MWLRETGITRFHLNDVIERRSSVTLREVNKEYDNHSGITRVLGLVPLGAGFTTLILGLLISAIVFLYELKQAAGTRRIREVLREIETKRDAYKRTACREKYRQNSTGFYRSQQKQDSTEDNLSEENSELFAIRSAKNTVSP